jgi:hypothetical protein
MEQLLLAHFPSLKKEKRLLISYAVFVCTNVCVCVCVFLAQLLKENWLIFKKFQSNIMKVKANPQPYF